MKKVFEGTSVRISRPMKKVELRFCDLDESIENKDILEIISPIGGCSITDVKCNGIRPMRNGMNNAWIECPIAAAVALLESGPITITIGWSRVRMDVIGNKCIRYYKCLAVGHPFQRCSNKLSMVDRCHKCGISGHLAAICSNKPRCLVCTERGLCSDHRAGSINCPPCLSKQFYASTTKIQGDRRPSLKINMTKLYQNNG